jgi:putative hemolysin
MDILIISALILLNGFFALSEIALVSSRRSRLEQMRKEKRKGAEIALKLLDNSGNFLSAIQVGITLIGILTGVYGGLSIADDVAPVMELLGIPAESANEVALALTVIIITYFSIVLGELVPKTIALVNPEKIAIRISGPVYWFSILLYPFVRFLAFSTSLINRILGIRKQSDALTGTELRHILRTASRQGVIELEQNMIHEKVFYFSDKKAKHIMTHRTEVEWIDLKKPAAQIRNSILRSEHSRLICCDGNLDNFTGILDVKEYLASLVSNSEAKIASLLTEPLIIPESAEAQKVLNLFRDKKTHFSVVVNEYGTLEGIITLHDILENLIGEIPEEGDTAEPDIFLRDDKSYLVSGDAPVEVLESIIETYTTDFEHIDYSTVAGFVLNKIDKVPQIGDKFTFNDYIIEIVDIDGRRIDKILVRKK